MEPVIQKRVLFRIIGALIALLILLTIGTAGYRWIENMNTVDALYMAVITVSTVGFGEVQQLSPPGRLFTIVLIVSGGGIAAYSLSAAAEFFFSGAWRIHLERRRRHKMMIQLKNHTIVCGYGRMGRHVVDELKAEKRQFVVIDPDEEKILSLQEAGYLALAGSGANDDDLRSVGIERAYCLIAVASTDAENVFIVLTARSLCPGLLIIARANDDISENKLLRAGADRVILPYRISGRRMVTLLVRPEVADFLDEVMHTNDLELLLDQVLLSPLSPLVGQTLGQAHLRSQIGVSVLACRMPDGHINTNPSAETPLESGAKLIVLGTRDQLAALLKLAKGE